MITLFTGAGASKAIGYPVTSEFFSTGGGAQLRNHSVYLHLKGFFNKDIVDVEDALRLLDPILALNRTSSGSLLEPTLRTTWAGKIQEFVHEANELCFEHYGRWPSEDIVRKVYSEILSYCSWDRKRVSLFTTNYDPVTDILLEIADSQGIPGFDGFNNLGVWNEKGYEMVVQKGLAVYRLHGSVSWVQAENGAIRNTRDYRKRAAGHHQHLIIYPGFKGNLDTEGHRVFRFAHAALRDELRKSSALLVIGFSFRDPHLNGIFRNAIETNANLKLIVWNPTWPVGPEVGLDELKKIDPQRVLHLDAKFGDSKIDIHNRLDSLLM